MIVDTKTRNVTLILIIPIKKHFDEKCKKLKIESLAIPTAERVASSALVLLVSNLPEKETFDEKPVIN